MGGALRRATCKPLLHNGSHKLLRNARVAVKDRRLVPLLYGEQCVTKARARSRMSDPARRGQKANRLVSRREPAEHACSDVHDVSEDVPWGMAKLSLYMLALAPGHIPPRGDDGGTTRRKRIALNGTRWESS